PGRGPRCSTPLCLGLGGGGRIGHRAVNREATKGGPGGESRPRTDTLLAPWAQEEMVTADRDDARLNRRLTRVRADRGCRPPASIPAACGGSNEMTAAYRFFDNDKGAPQKILQPPYERPRPRRAAREGVLLVQDTRAFDRTWPPQPVQGPGPLDTAA